MREILHLWCACALGAAAAVAVGALALGAERAPMPKDGGPISFTEIVTAAREDARACGAPSTGHTRYLCAAHESDAEVRAKLHAVAGGYQVNSLSREPQIVRARRVNAWLWAIDVRDYGKDFAKAWEAFERDNPYFLVKVKEQAAVTKQVTRVVPKQITERVKKTRQVVRYDQWNRAYYATEEYTEDVTRTAEEKVTETVTERAAVKEAFVAGPWVPQTEWGELVKMTGSATPIVHADLFFDRTSTQKTKFGNGYLDFLGLKKTNTLKDLDDLIRFRDADAVATRNEVFAIVMKSGVARFPRQIDRKPAATGPRWQTGDTDEPTGDGNALDRLFDAYKVKAREYVAALPNKLPVTFLADGEGKTQTVAPNAIVGNHRAVDNELEIDVGTVDCFLCHRGALAKVRDYGRKKYADRTGIRLAVVDPDLKRRAEYAYLTEDFADEFESDQKRFDRKYKEASGLETKDLVEAVSEVIRRYRADGVNLKRAAARAGVAPEALRTRLRDYAAAKAKAGVPADSVLTEFLLDDEDAEPIPVELFEERFPVLMLILGGANP